MVTNDTDAAIEGGALVYTGAGGLTVEADTEIFGFTIIPKLTGGAAMLGGAIAIAMVYVVRSAPGGLRTGVASLQQIDPSIEEASTSLGANQAHTFRRITLPLIRPAFLAVCTHLG